jgi:TolB-like protein/Flp pilus assembly protein TadD/predicted Ser/Thr protein kinase
MIGATLAHYRILRPLGTGGMGHVFLARDTRLERDVALKLIREEFAADGERLARFEREARAIAALNHPSIVTIYAIEEDSGRRFFTMEFVEGRTLREVTPPVGLPAPELLRVGVALADALAAAHARGIVHRDLKPANVMITHEGRVKVLDFGLAKMDVSGLPTATAVGRAADLGATRHGAVLGTTGYMAPEQVKGQPVDTRADLFALGLVLFEAASGRHPFPGDDAWARNAATLTLAPLPLERLRPDLPLALGRLLLRCLERDAAARPAGAAAVRAELEGIAGQIEAATGRGHSVAVLPFADLSAAQDQGYFCEGIAEELLAVLTRIEGLRVASRTSAVHLHHRRLDIRDIGRQLNVNAVLEGSVRKAGERLRITAQLIDVASGYHVWSERFDRTLDDIFAIQDEIAARTAEALRGVLTAQDEAVLHRERREDPRAYDYYLRGRKLLDQLWITRFEVAREMFRKAIEIDPKFARVWANISLTHAYEYIWFGRRHEHLEAALAAGHRAVELDPDLAEGRASTGFALAFGDRFEEARGHFERALEIGPTNWEAHFLYGRACWAQGDMNRAAELFARAAEIAPDDYQAPALAAQPLEESGQSERAMRFARVTVERVRLRLERDPDDGRALYMGAIALHRLGEYERALEWARRAAETAPPEEFSTHYNLGCFYARIGDRERALKRLEQCVSLAGGFLEWIADDRDWDSLRGDPRFEELLNRLP